MKKKILLAYSGGLDTSAIVPWLMENYDADVIAYCCNLGNQPDEKTLRTRALSLGAVDFIFEDTQEEFARSYIIPSMRSGATYFDDYLLGTALARPLIAQRMAHWAKTLNVGFIAHGATGKGNDHLRFERGWAFLCPDIPVIAPWKLWGFKGRTDLARYLNGKTLEGLGADKTFSVDINLLHRSCEGGVLEDPSKPYDVSEVQELTQMKTQETPTRFKLDFQDGTPRLLNGKPMELHSMMVSLNHIGRAHGIGVVDLIEERTNGIKSRGIYETPGGTILSFAYKELKRLCWSRELYFVGQKLAHEYGRLIYDGLWFSDARFHLESFFESATKNLSGSIEGEVIANRVVWRSRQSPTSLYNGQRTSFESDTEGLNKASLGFTQFLTAPLRQQGSLLTGYSK